MEVALQIRSQLIEGQSIFVRFTSEGDYVVDASGGLRLLRPNVLIKGRRQEIRSNSLGLRSPELPRRKGPAEYRIAIVGASSVMGAYSATNDYTMPAYLERRLRQALPGAQVNVINAGIVGATVDAQAKMVEYVDDRLDPDFVLVYSGVNDFAGYCRLPQEGGRRSSPYRLPALELPPWLMSVDMLLKNTVPLRPAARVGPRIVNPRALDLTPYRNAVRRIVDVARAHGIEVMLSTNTRAYRPEQPIDVQEQLSRTARYYNSCFDVAGLHTLYQRHNAVIREVATERSVRLLPLGELVPGGSTYFNDATHFNDAGKQLVAELFAKALAEAGYPGRGARP